MRPEQRQRLAVLVDTAIVKVGLTPDSTCQQPRHSGRGCTVLLSAIHSWDGALPHVPCQTLEPSSGRALPGIGALPAHACQELWAQPLSSWTDSCACQAGRTGDGLPTCKAERAEMRHRAADSCSKKCIVNPPCGLRS